VLERDFPVSAVEFTAEKLRKWILNQVPATQVTEADVATWWGVSRPTAKSAITVLVKDRMLRQEPNKPAYVPRLSSADVRDLFLVRIPLELLVVRLVIAQRFVPLDAAAAVFAMSQLTEATPTDEFVRADLGFHHALVDSVGSPRLNSLYQAILGEIHLSMVQSKTVLGPEVIADDHGNVLDALRRQDEERATELMRNHLQGACDKISAALDELVHH
jgi:DNA-binding GntR family transcriptional regulator